jgi:small subunit ribosomal protein S9
MVNSGYYATGRRKTAVARVWIKQGANNIYNINGKNVQEYFKDSNSINVIEKPFVVTDTKGKFEVWATLTGGGRNAQIEALRHGISRALLIVDPELRVALKRAGFLTRDPRMKERKKYGLAAARKRYQYSKR